MLLATTVVYTVWGVFQDKLLLKLSLANLQEASSSTPIFGSASTFGTGSGFAGFTGVDTSKSKAVASESAQKDEEEDAGNDEECAAEYVPVVQLQEVETSTGEETETALYDV